MPHTITLTDEQTGQQHLGTIPKGWHEVPLAAFVRYHELQQLQPDTPPFQHVMAALTGLPPQVLAEDESIAAVLAPHLAFFHEGLPAGEAPAMLEHGGQVYHHIGEQQLKFSASQYEALLNAQDAGRGPGGAVVAAAELLAVLYQPAGRKLTTASFRATAAAFLSLPMATAWPAFAHFVQTWQLAALNAKRYELAYAQAEASLTLTEQALVPGAGGGGRPGVVGKAARSLMRRHLKSVRRRLATLEPPAHANPFTLPQL